MAKTKDTDTTKKPRGHGWRTKIIKPANIELTEEELQEQQEQQEAEQRKHTGPIRSKKVMLGEKAHLCIRIRQATIDWLAAEAQIKSTTVSQLVRAWIEAKERQSYMDTQSMLGRSDG